LSARLGFKEIFLQMKITIRSLTIAKALKTVQGSERKVPKIESLFPALIMKKARNLTKFLTSNGKWKWKWKDGKIGIKIIGRTKERWSWSSS